MKIGFLTGCLGDIPLYEKAKFARSAGFQALEISAWPKENTRDYSGSDIDFETFDAQEAQKIRTYLDDMGLEYLRWPIMTTIWIAIQSTGSRSMTT